MSKRKQRQILRHLLIEKNIQSVRAVILEYYQLLCDGFDFYSTWDDVCEAAKNAEIEREES